MGGFVDEAAQLLFTRQRAALGATGGDDSAEHDQALRNRTQHHAHGSHQRCGESNNRPGIGDTDSAGRGADNHEEDSDHNPTRNQQRLPPVIHQLNHGERNQHGGKGFDDDAHESERRDVADDIRRDST